MRATSTLDVDAISEATEAFRSAIAAAGIQPPECVLPDGKIHRFSTNGRRDDDAGWYILFGDYPPTGKFGDFRSGIESPWSARDLTSLSPSEVQAHRHRLTLIKKQREEEEARGHAQAAARAATLWESMPPAPPNHSYLVKKGVPAHHLRIYRGDLSIAGCRVDGAVVVPLCDEHGKLWSLEFICTDGEKRFLSGGRKHGCYCLLGEIAETVCITEGYATGASVHQCTGLPVGIAFDAMNLKPVAEALRVRHPSVKIIICGDNDERGTGQAKAQEAAQAVGGLIVLPETRGDDWNDVQQQKGSEAVRTIIQALVWPPVIPLDDVILHDFPVDAFPNPLRTMIEAEAAATETPLELAAMLGLGTVSAACQGKFEVQGDLGYCEPCNVWAVAALESGNRKTQVHRDMTAPLLAKERELCEASKATIAQAESERATTEARVKAIRARIANSEDFEDIAQGQREIDRLLAEMPDVPTVPRLWAQDITPEKLGAMMADNGERLALLSDEGGLFDILAGRYSNGVPNLDLFLQSHAGAPVRVDRGSRPPLVMHRPALTIALSPQPGVLRGLTGKPGFRERGLLARFLYTLPPSRLGYRQLQTTPVPTRVRDAYHQMVTTLLQFEPPWNERGEAVAHVIHLSPEAKQEQREFAQAVEVNMRPDKPYEFLKDWAGKLPGAALRVAGIFHCVQHAQRKPWDVPLSLETMRMAIAVLVVIGEHTRAVFDLMGADPAIDGARKVWRWVERTRQQQFTARECFQALRGTFSLAANLDQALSILCERGYLLSEENQRSGPGRRSRRFTVSPTITKGWT